LDGHATLIEMRADRDLQSLPVLFLTARTGGADLAAGLELGAQDYLRKPCDAAELTARVAMALRAKAQADAIARHSTTDVLTGLGNRRQMDETVAELTAMHDPGAAVTVIMLDVDHFKAVNDTYGHAVGDVVLKIVAGRLRGALDKGVSVARWGGEEFVVVAVGLGGAQAHALADHVRQAVSHTPFSTGVDQTIIVTVSAGCAIAPLSAFSAALEAADGALYEAKRAGRNCVVVAAPVL
jgi:two-component system cell cycle response regulator